MDPLTVGELKTTLATFEPEEDSLPIVMLSGQHWCYARAVSHSHLVNEVRGQEVNRFPVCALLDEEDKK